MATVTVPTTSTLPVAGGDIIAAPLNGWITNLKTFVEGNNIDENNVDYTNSDGIVVMGQAQTITGLKTFENASAAAGGVRTAAIFSIDPASGTPTDGDGVEILFQADDDEGNVATIAELEAIMTDTDNGDEDSEVKIKALVAGSAAEFMVAGTPADGSGRVVFNDASADIDFRIETNNIANGFVVDAGLDVFAFGAAAADDKFVTISPPAATHATTVDTYALHVTAGGAQTIPSGTTALVASVAIEEPNITATGTVTNAATLYIKNAPTEGGSNYALWVDDGTAKFDSTVTIADGSLTLGSTAVSATAAEINLIDGGTSRGTTAVASGDGILINDAGTMRMTNVDTVSTYFSSHSVGGSNIVTTGALNSGSITSGFGTIDTGSSTITTTGVITSGGFTIGSAVVDETELEILDGATVTTDELNLIDGGTARGTTAVASGDGILINDAGTMRMTNVDTVSTYFSSHSVGGSNIVTVGTISSGTWQGNKVASAYLDDDTAHLGVVQTFTANKTFTGTLTVGADDTGKDVKFFGASAGAYMEWDESADQLRLMGASADATTSTGKLLLATSLTNINANDVLGKVDFQAPHEDGGTDATAIAASIQAIAQDTFSASVNATDLIFYTGHSEAATEKFRFTSQGELGVGGANYGSDGQVLTSTGAGTAPAWESVAAGVSLSGTTNDTIATVTGANALQGEANLTFNGSILTVAGTANAKQLNVSASGAALGSQNASKIILVDLNDPATMWDVEEFLARARFTSWYQELGAPPMRGAIFLNNANTSIVWWNLDTDTQYISFDVGGSNNDDANMIYISSIKPSCIAFLDGKIYFGVSNGGGGGAWNIDLLRDECIGWFASGQRRYEGNIEERNDGKGNASTRTSVQIKNGTVSGIAATRDRTLSDEFDRPVQWWSAGTSSGASLYNPHNDAIYDWHDSNRQSTHQFLMNDKWMFMRNQTTYQGVNWVQMSAVDADNVTVEQHFHPWNSADGSNRNASSFPWDKSATITGIAGNSAASQVYIASTQGLCRITFPTEDYKNDIYGWIWTTSTYQTPYMKGTRVAAYPLNDVNDRSKGTGQNLTNNNSVTFATGGPTGNYADFVAASSQSLTAADHANFGGMSELTLSCWINRDIDAGADVGILSKFSTTDGSNQSFTLVCYHGGGDTVLFEINTSGGSSSVESTTPLVVGKWTHIAATYDGANMKIYINGLLEQTTARTGTIDDSTEQFIIGARSGNTNTESSFFDGKIGGVSISATAMTYNEVRLEYQRGLRVLGGATAKLANTDVKSVQVDPDTGLAAVTTAANQTEIWDIETGLRQSIDGTTTATVADADVALKTGATLPEYITARSGAIEFDGQTRSVV